jgi:hypothetical protein
MKRLFVFLGLALTVMVTTAAIWTGPTAGGGGGADTFISIGGVTNTQSGVTLPNGTFSGTLAFFSLLSGGGGQTNGTINSNLFFVTSSPAIPGFNFTTYALTNDGGGGNSFYVNTGNTNQIGTNAGTHHVQIRNLTSGLIATNYSFDANTNVQQWKLQSASGTPTNINASFARIWNIGTGTNDHTRIASAIFSNSMTRFEKILTLRTNMTLGDPTFTHNAWITIITSNSALNAIDVFSGNGLFVKIGGNGSVTLNGFLTLAQPETPISVNKSAMMTMVPDVTWGQIGHPGLGSHLYTWFSDVIDSLAAETNSFFPQDMPMLDILVRERTNRQAVIDLYNHAMPFASLEFLSTDQSNVTNALFGITVTNGQLTIGPVDTAGIPLAGKGAVYGTNGDVSFGTNALVSDPVSTNNPASLGYVNRIFTTITNATSAITNCSLDTGQSFNNNRGFNLVGYGAIAHTPGGGNVATGRLRRDGLIWPSTSVTFGGDSTTAGETSGMCVPVPAGSTILWSNETGNGSSVVLEFWKQ